MDVVLAAHGARVAEALGHLVDRLDHVAVGFAPARRRALAPELDGGKHGAAPGAKVLSGDVAAGGLAQIVVHVVRRDEMALARRIEILKKLLPRQVATALDD